MLSRPAWLERYRVRNIFKNSNRKAVYVDKSSQIVEATHYNLAGGTYAVPRKDDETFLREYVDFVFGPNNGNLALTENAIVSEEGRSFSSVFIDIDLRYPLDSNGKWSYEELESALNCYTKALYEHVNVEQLDTDQRIWIMVCKDHPITHTKGGVQINKKNGIHVYFPDLAMDRRKLQEIRNDSIDLGPCFAGCENNREDIFDNGVYKVEVQTLIHLN